MPGKETGHLPSGVMEHPVSDSMQLESVGYIVSSAHFHLYHVLCSTLAIVLHISAATQSHHPYL